MEYTYEKFIQINGFYKSKLRPIQLDNLSDIIEIGEANVSDSKIYVPNAFSPNGDNNNDFLTAFGAFEIKTIKIFKVFDRWGSLVFTTSNITPNVEILGWDGNFENTPAPQGEYTYFINYELIDGSIKSAKGDFLLVR